MVLVVASTSVWAGVSLDPVPRDGGTSIMTQAGADLVDLVVLLVTPGSGAVMTVLVPTLGCAEGTDVVSDIDCILVKFRISLAVHGWRLYPRLFEESFGRNSGKWQPPKTIGAGVPWS